MRSLFLFIWLFLFSLMSFGQSDPDLFCSDTSYRVLQRLKGDSIYITCDTAYILNTTTFHLLHSSYLEYQKQSDLITIFTDSAEALISVYKEHVNEQMEQFDALSQSYRDLSTTSNSLIDETTQKLVILKGNIDSIGDHISTAQLKIDEAIDLVKKAENKKWLWGVGGLCVGFVFATVILAVQ